MTKPLRVTVNGETYTREVEPRVSLADFLRQELRLTGTNVGCEHGVCGACTVQIDGEPVRSCLMLALQAQHATITTIEGIAPGNDLHPLQAAFQNAHALQCGFCTPGFIMTLEAFLRECPEPSEAEIRAALSANLCRCTGYQAMVSAVRDAAKELQSRARLESRGE